LFLPVSLLAQKDAASLEGRVVDARGAVVAQAAVTAINAPGPQNSNDATVFGTPSFGFVTAAQSPRLIQFAAKLHY
jgi:hypothetical protein